jgi:hypothetical protein
MNKAIITAIGLLLIFIGDPVRSEPQEPDARDEVQVLIDVSGSMRQNDPKNLRIEAGKLLISLLPETSKASIWLFAENTLALTHSDAVDAAWKNQALKDAARIHSRGLYTNIEEAIQNVLDSGFKGSGNKNLILLTDGVVDISKDIMVSADSRERILSEWIPKLQQQNIKVETIALSDQADKELLDKLAFDTGGWTETAQSAEQLQRVFLKMVQKAAPKDTLPLNGNQFAVDGGVKEFSVLAFKKPNSAPSQLLTPEQKTINKQTSSANVAWLENPAYDLITVKQPGVGDWRLEAETDPDNQVMIVTDLKMRLDELPNFIAEKEAVTLKVHFTDQGKPITRTDFLNMITVAVSLDGKPPLSVEPVAGQAGFFGRSFGDLSPGKHSFKIVADGKTFKRELQKEIDVVAAPIVVEKIIDPDKREVTLKLIPDSALLDVKTLAIKATINRAGKPPETQSVVAKDGAWAIKLEALAPGSETTVNFNATVQALDGKPISPAIKPVKIDDGFFLKNLAESVPEPQPQPVEHGVHAEPALDKHEEAPPTATNWLLVGGVVLGINLLIFGGGFFIYRAMKKANADKQKQLLEKLS